MHRLLGSLMDKGLVGYDPLICHVVNNLKVIIPDAVLPESTPPNSFRNLVLRINYSDSLSFA